MDLPERIYLDNNATTPIDPAVQAAMTACSELGLGNPSSQHASGRRARQILEDSRERIGELLGANLTGPDSDRLIFTSGGTEANNLAILGTLPESMGKVLVSAIEHPSVQAAAEEFARRGGNVRWLSVDGAGVIDLDELGQILVHDRPDLVCIMAASNETGVLEPVADAASLCARYGVPMHTDAVQMVGKLAMDFRRIGASTLSLAAHKFHGPPGIGALLARSGVPLRPQVFGGHQQAGLRPGTEPVTLVVGMCRALELWHEAGSHRVEQQRALRDRFERRLKSGWTDLVVHSQQVARLPNTSNVALPGIDRQALLMALDLAGIECSAGSACASGASQPSKTLVAMGLPDELALGSLRFSLGAQTTEGEIDAAADRILSLLHRFEPTVN